MLVHDLLYLSFTRATPPKLDKPVFQILRCYFLIPSASKLLEQTLQLLLCNVLVDR
jgi:hypothetical protein